MRAQGPLEYILLFTGSLLLALMVFAAVVATSGLAEPISRLGKLVLWRVIP